MLRIVMDGAGDLPEAWIMVRTKLNCNELVLAELSIAVAVNLGPGTVGIVAYPIEESG